MIIKNNFNKTKIEYLEQEQLGLNKAISKLDERFKKQDIDRETFLKQNALFAKRQQVLKRKQEKLNRR